jgi:hypothetical protein
MIKFFRHIRQRLLTEGKLARYLAYAIGEIVLVVIGILIALQLNNWNSEQKERALEVETLKELRTAFEEDLMDINYNLDRHKSGLIASERLLNAFDQELPYNDSLDRHFGQYLNISVLVYSTGAFETLKSRGMDIIGNDSLRRQVVRMYDLIYNEILENQRSFDFVDLQENKEFMFEHMTEWKFFKSAKPKDYNKISKDPVFRNRLEYTLQIRNMTCRKYLRAKRECESVLKNLDREIKRLSKDE